MVSWWGRGRAGCPAEGGTLLWSQGMQLPGHPAGKGSECPTVGGGGRGGFPSTSSSPPFFPPLVSTPLLAPTLLTAVSLQERPLWPSPHPSARRLWCQPPPPPVVLMADPLVPVASECLIWVGP